MEASSSVFLVGEAIADRQRHQGTSGIAFAKDAVMVSGGTFD
jgi:hypothetical protein